MIHFIFTGILFLFATGLFAMEPLDSHPSLTTKKRAAADELLNPSKKAAVSDGSMPLSLLPITDVLRSAKPLYEEIYFSDEIWAKILGYVFYERNPVTFSQTLIALCKAQNKAGASLLYSKSYTLELHEVLLQNCDFRLALPIKLLKYTPQAAYCLNDTPAARAQLDTSLEYMCPSDGPQLFEHVLKSMHLPFFSGKPTALQIQRAEQALSCFKIFTPFLASMIRTGITQQCRGALYARALRLGSPFVKYLYAVSGIGTQMDKERVMQMRANGESDENRSVSYQLTKRGTGTIEVSTTKQLHRWLDKMLCQCQQPDGTILFNTAEKMQALEKIMAQEINFTETSEGKTPCQRVDEYCSAIQANIQTIRQKIAAADPSMNLKRDLEIREIQLKSWQVVQQLLNPQGTVPRFIQQVTQARKERVAAIEKKLEKEARAVKAFFDSLPGSAADLDYKPMQLSELISGKSADKSAF